jgi:hypothetical protein
MDTDPFTQNLIGVDDLVSSHANKVYTGNSDEEGVVGDYQDELSLDLSDEELLDLKKTYESQDAGYSPLIKPRQIQNKKYLLGGQRNNSTRNIPVASNLLFQSTATFVPQALAKNPEPVVFSDNTPQGKEASKGLKTMLQFHAEQFLLRKKLGIMVWQWSTDFIAILKYGWDEKTKDITVDVRNPKNFVWAPPSYVDEYGDFVGWLGERIETTATKLIELYPKHKDFITEQVAKKMGTKVIRTEWWTDDYCFTTYKDKVLDKHKNEFFNYDTKGESTEESEEGEETLKGHNHFATPKMPYTFLSIFSLQEQPHDITNLIEQNIANQDMINDRDNQITANLRVANNAVAISGVSFNQETASQAVETFYGNNDGTPSGFVLVPDGRISDAIQRIPANDLPSAIFTAQENAKNTLMGVYGTQGLSATAPDTDTTAHGEVINTNRDSSRIGGGVGESLEQVASNFFNKLTQMYYVFYDEAHYGAVIGNGAAVSFIKLQMQDEERRFIVGISPNSMVPKDEVSQVNLATQLFEAGASDPLTYLEAIDDPDPQETALRMMIYRTNPQQYIQSYLSPTPEQQQQGQAPPGQMPNQAGEQNPSLSEPPESSSLAQVGMKDNSQMPNL